MRKRPPVVPSPGAHSEQDWVGPRLSQEILVQKGTGVLRGNATYKHKVMV